MGVVTKTLVTVNVDGQEVVSELTKAQLEVFATCDNDNCQQGQFNPELNKKTAKTVVWMDGDPDSVPDSFYPILTLEDTSGQKKVFCSKGCLKSYLNDYKPLKSPRLENVVDISDANALMRSPKETGVFA